MILLVIMDVSPKYMMDLIARLETAIWDMFDTSKYVNVERYIKKWHWSDGDGWNHEENFQIYTKEKHIDLGETLHDMPPDIVIKIAMDVGVDTPNFLPAIPTFKNILKERNENAYQNFERAIKDVYDNPDVSVSLASATLEGIIKTILSFEPFLAKKSDLNKKSCASLVKEIVREFNLAKSVDCPQELITIASQLRGLGAAIDSLRSNKSTAHGKSHDDYVVDDPLWASLIVNTTATLGLFLWEFYEVKYRPTLQKAIDSDMAQTLVEDIPF
jgi:hypothetical protein